MRRIAYSIHMANKAHNTCRGLLNQLFLHPQLRRGTVDMIAMFTIVREVVSPYRFLLSPANRGRSIVLQNCTEIPLCRLEYWYVYYLSVHDKPRRPHSHY